MDKGSTILELSRSPILPQTWEDLFSITMEVTTTMEEVRTTIVAPRMGIVGVKTGGSRVGGPELCI